MCLHVIDGCGYTAIAATVCAAGVIFEHWLKLIRLMTNTNKNVNSNVPKCGTFMTFHNNFSTFLLFIYTLLCCFCLVWWARNYHTKNDALPSSLIVIIINIIVIHIRSISALPLPNKHTENGKIAWHSMYG